MPENMSNSPLWKIGGAIGALALVSAWVGAEEPAAAPMQEESFEASDTSSYDAVEPDVPPTPQPAPEVKGGETYAEYDARRDELGGSAGYSGGYGCTVDCGGHDAGREWAEMRGIDDPDDCGGKSWSFEEGCRSYAEEQEEERRTENENREEEDEE